MRQFGMEQLVPSQPNHNLADLHKIGSRGHKGTNWTSRHGHWIEQWAARRRKIHDGVPAQNVSIARPEYTEWYKKNTRAFIVNPSHRGLNEDGYHATGSSAASASKRVTEWIEEALPGGCQHCCSYFEKVKDFLSIVIEAIDSKLGIQHVSSKIVVPPQCRPKNPILSRGARGRKRGAKRRHEYRENIAQDEEEQQLGQNEPEDHEVRGGLLNIDTQDCVRQVVQVEDPTDVADSSHSDTVSLARSMNTRVPISWPSDGFLTVAWVMELMQTFDWGSRSLQPSEFSSMLPFAVFEDLVLSASRILQKEPNCVKIEQALCPTSKVIVVGDVHGQLHDLLHLLRETGHPSSEQIFVFNGDYVDKGAWGLEIFLLLLAWKVLFPHRVFLLRGNHETKYCTSVYGFEQEVLVKYGDEGKDAYRKCLDCFKVLPLASIIAGKVYTAHGGLFRSITHSKRSKRRKGSKVVLDADTETLSLGSLEDLAQVQRFMLDPPWKGQNLILGDILWSDPSMKPGLSHNADRGKGLLWGPDCTEGFLKKSGVKLIIRSHEGHDTRENRPGLGGMEKGYTIDHVVDSGSLITVFSAPDCPQFQATDDRYRNKGAYIVLRPPGFDIPDFHSFEAVLPRPQLRDSTDPIT